MREQWGEDEGRAHVAEHRQAMIDEFRRARARRWTTSIPTSSSSGATTSTRTSTRTRARLCRAGVRRRRRPPLGSRRTCAGPTPGTSPKTKSFTIKGDRRYGKFVATALLSQGFDIAYSYKPLHGSGLGHAVVNSVLYMDWDRRGFDYPVVPITVNSYGRDLVRAQGRPQTPSEALAIEDEPRPAWTAALALLPAGRRRRPGGRREPLARGSDRLVELVALLPRRRNTP